MENESLLERKYKETVSKYSFSKYNFLIGFCFIIAFICFFNFINGSQDENRGTKLIPLTANIPSLSLSSLVDTSNSLCNSHEDEQYSDPDLDVKYMYADGYSLRVRANIEEYLKNSHKTGDPQRIEPFGNASHSYGFKIAKEYNLVYSSVYKSMSTVMTNLFCYLFNSENFLMAKQSIASNAGENRICGKINQYRHYWQVLEALGQEPNILTVVREPLERFESAYLDKCIHEGRPCFECHVEDIFCILTYLKENLKSYRVIQDINNTISNPFNHYLTLHMVPQTWFGELPSNYNRTVFLKYASSGKRKIQMIVNLTDQLLKLNVPLEKVRFIQQDLLDGGRTKHSTKKMTAKNKVSDLIRSSRQLFQLFMSIYRDDYDILGFHIPVKNF